MGGVHVDSSGRTTLDGLWACGEVASTGVHGANRLAANALLEAVVFAARVAEDIQGQLPRHKGARWAEPPAVEAPSTPEEDDEATRTLRATMSRHVGVVRDEAGLSEALATIDRLSTRVARTAGPQCPDRRQDGGRRGACPQGEPRQPLSERLSGTRGRAVREPFMTLRDGRSNGQGGPEGRFRGHVNACTMAGSNGELLASLTIVKAIRSG